MEKQMKTQKINYFIIFLLLLTIKVSAQFTGFYNLHDGGVDAPNSSLIVLPNNEFFLFYLGGYKAGKWNEVDKNNILLTEVKTNTSPFTLYGKANNKFLETRIDVDGLAQFHASINFSKDTISEKTFQPVFNDFPNCMNNEYVIKKKKGEFKMVTITVPENPKFGQYEIKYPYKVLSYTYTIDKKYNDYIFIINQGARESNIQFTLTKKNEIYKLAGSKDLTREELDSSKLSEIEKTKKLIEIGNNRIKLGTKIATIATNNFNILTQSLVKPLFIAQCEDSEPEVKVVKIKKPTANRINGFYSVINYKDNDYNTAKYQLAKEPSMTKNDVLSITKKVPDYGGFEILVKLTEDGKAKFAALTKKNLKKPIVIVCSKTIFFAPIISSEITGGEISINGDFSETEIDDFIINFKK